MTTKLFQLQQKVGVISKDSKNPFFNSAYFDINKLIEVLKPLLNEIGLTIIQSLKIDNGKSLLSTAILDSETGELIYDSGIYLPDNLDPQKMGSAITYYRRYSLQSMLLLQAEDDDGYVTKPKETKTESHPMNDIADKYTGTMACTKCGSTNVKHLKGISKKTNKAYDFHSCQDCKNPMN